MRSLAACLALLLGSAAAVTAPEVAHAGHHETEEAAAEKPNPWDAEKAAAAARELAEALEGLRRALRQQPPPGAGIAPGGGSRATHRLRDQLRLMESESRFLRDQLAAGAGRDATLPVFERIDSIRRDAIQQAQRTFLQEPVKQKIVAAREPMLLLASYYGVEFDRQLRMR